MLEKTTMSSKIPKTPTWMSDDASSICMKCGAEFGRLLGASRHHCRACGELICQTCMTEGTKESHVLEYGKEEVVYLAPESQYTILDRPGPTSVIKSAYEAFSNTTNVVKFCQACVANISKEHRAFRQATYLLSAFRFFGHERRIRIASLCIRAHFAKYGEPTGMSILGKNIVTILREGFYKPRVRLDLRLYDQTLNQLVAGFFRTFFANHLGSTTSPEVCAKIESILVSRQGHNFLHHIFLSCLLNSAHIPDIRADTLRYLLMDPYRCMHMLLSRYTLNYKVTIYSVFQAKAWKSVLAAHKLDFFLNYPHLLADVARSATLVPAPFSKFVNMCRIVSPKSMPLLLCNTQDETMFAEVCRTLHLDCEKTTTLFQTVHAKLLSIVHDTERLDHSIQIPWTQTVPNALQDLNSMHPMADICTKIFSQEPRTIQVDHVVSSKVYHVARIFQSWYIYAEPNFVLNQAMRHVFDLTKKVNSMELKTPLYDNMEYIHNSDLTLVVLPGTLTESRVVHVDKNTFSQNVETTLDVLVTVLLLQHFAQFVQLDVHPSLHLVEVGTTRRNTQIVNACLTYSGTLAVREHMLKGSLHAHTVLGINSILADILHNHLPELYMGLLCVTKAGVPHARVVEFLDDIGAIVRKDATRELVLKYLV